MTEPPSVLPVVTAWPDGVANATPPRRNLFFLVLAWVCIALGVIGAFLPVMPTTPFLLVAAWAASRGSPRLHRWLIDHPTLGPPLRAWEEKRAVATSSKWLACGFMTASWLIMYVLTVTWLVPAITGVIFISVGTFLVTRPAP